MSNAQILFATNSGRLIGKMLQLRNPTLYKNFTCPMCNIEYETVAHIGSCTGHRAIEAKAAIFTRPCLPYYKET
jgi:transcription elongation factor Elf1